MVRSGFRSAAFLWFAAIAALWPFVGAAAPVESVLYRFKGGADGALPLGGLTIDRDGNLYGTTPFDDSCSCHFTGGTVFKLAPPIGAQNAWTHTVLHHFLRQHGADPEAPPIMDASGALFGTTSGGGSFGAGTVYKLRPPAGKEIDWHLTTIHSFTGEAYGDSPESGLILSNNGTLFGTTYSTLHSRWFGTVFEITPPPAGRSIWTKSVIHRFNGPNGRYPQAGLMAGTDGSLYGTTPAGGANPCDCGTVYRMTPPADGKSAWTEEVIYAFEGGYGGGVDGSGPSGTLIEDASGALYGTTANGGLRGGGTVFKLAPPGSGETRWTETVLYSFTATDGGGVIPLAGVIAGPDGVLYGTTYSGGVGLGTVYKLAPPAAGQTKWTETVLHSFTGGADGFRPQGELIADKNGALFGTTSYGGGTGCQKLGCGTVFKVVP